MSRKLKEAASAIVSATLPAGTDPAPTLSVAAYAATIHGQIAAAFGMGKVAAPDYRMEDAHAEALELNTAADAARAALADGVRIGLVEPEPLPLPESASVRDAAIDAGEVQQGPSDMEIIELVAETFDLPFAEALERVAVIAFAELRAMKEVAA